MYTPFFRARREFLICMCLCVVNVVVSDESSLLTTANTCLRRIYIFILRKSSTGDSPLYAYILVSRCGVSWHTIDSPRSVDSSGNGKSPADGWHSKRHVVRLFADPSPSVTRYIFWEPPSDRAEMQSEKGMHEVFLETCSCSSSFAFWRRFPFSFSAIFATFEFLKFNSNRCRGHSRVYPIFWAHCSRSLIRTCIAGQTVFSFHSRALQSSEWICSLKLISIWLNVVRHVSKL